MTTEYMINDRAAVARSGAVGIPRDDRQQCYARITTSLQNGYTTAVQGTLMFLSATFLTCPSAHDVYDTTDSSVNNIHHIGHVEAVSTRPKNPPSLSILSTTNPIILHLSFVILVLLIVSYKCSYWK